MAVLFRLGIARNLVETDSLSSVAFRIYILKTEEMLDLETRAVDKLGYLTSETEALIVPIADRYHNIMMEFFSSSKIEGDMTPTRCLIHYEGFSLEDAASGAGDDYFSIVLAYKVKLYRNARINEARKQVICPLLKEGIQAFHVVNFDTHMPCATWDHDHVLVGPTVDWTRTKITDMFPSLQTKTSAKKGKDVATRRPLRARPVRVEESSSEAPSNESSVSKEALQEGEDVSKEPLQEGEGDRDVDGDTQISTSEPESKATRKTRRTSRSPKVDEGGQA